MLARNDDLKARLEAAPEWDLIVCDEAHRMSASFFGQEVRYTRRYQLGALAGRLAHHFLLMTATPHNGKEEDFQLFMGLLDADRFEGRFREGIHKVDPSDMMRRLTKEELLRFDGTPLFPERRACTVSYQLSSREAGLYEAVTHYGGHTRERAARSARAKRGAKADGSANFTRVISGAPISGDKIRTEGRAGRLGARLTAAVAKGNLIPTQAKRNLSSRSGIGGVRSAT